MSDKCLRTAFISRIVAPHASNFFVIIALSSIVILCMESTYGALNIEEPPPEIMLITDLKSLINRLIEYKKRVIL